MGDASTKFINWYKLHTALYSAGLSTESFHLLDERKYYIILLLQSKYIKFGFPFMFVRKALLDVACY